MAMNRPTRSSAPPSGYKTEDDEGNEKHHPARRCRASSNHGGQRLACPYFRRYGTGFSTGSCNGKGFTDIHRVKAHIKDHHKRALGWQRCHVCKARFRDDEIKGHEPCTERDNAVDYEYGIDSAQLCQLVSKEMAPKKYPSDEACWHAIFRMLFPDWPENQELPSAYQGGQAGTPQQVIIEVREMLRRPEITTEIISTVGQGRGEQALQRIFDRAFADLNSKFVLKPAADGRQQHLELVAGPSPPPGNMVGHASATSELLFPGDQVNVDALQAGAPGGNIWDLSESPSHVFPQDDPPISRHNSNKGSSGLNSCSMLGSGLGLSSDLLCSPTHNWSEVAADDWGFPSVNVVGQVQWTQFVPFDESRHSPSQENHGWRRSIEQDTSLEREKGIFQCGQEDMA